MLINMSARVLDTFLGTRGSIILYLIPFLQSSEKMILIFTRDLETKIVL